MTAEILNRIAAAANAHTPYGYRTITIAVPVNDDGPPEWYIQVPSGTSAQTFAAAAAALESLRGQLFPGLSTFSTLRNLRTAQPAGNGYHEK